jgi:hypothetical protein
MNPYAAPSSAPAEEPETYRVWRVLGFALLVHGLSSLVAFLSGFAVSIFATDGAPIEVVLDRLVMARILAIGLAISLACWWMLVPMRSRRGQHALALWLVKSLVGIAIGVVVDEVPIARLVDVRGVMRDLLAVLAGFGLAQIGANRRARAADGAVGR